MKTIYTAHATTKGGRGGEAKTSDGALTLKLVPSSTTNAKPNETNPEQLFACGYAACFGSALDMLAKKQELDATNAEVAADVNLNQDDHGYFLSVTLKVTLPNIQGDAAQKLVEATHQFCPYSEATRGNVEVTLIVNQQPIKQAA